GYISACAILFIIIGTFSLTLAYEIGHYNLTDFYRAPFIKGIYRLLFAILGLIYSCYCLNHLIAKKVKAISISGNSKGDHSLINDNARDIYKKDRLGEESIKKNGERLDKLMRIDRVYLDSSLNLTKLASLLKISEHNLSQVLSRYVGCSFYKYINQLRIAYAVEVMKSSQGDDISIENIVTQCGYNNRVTFNRYFKEFTGLQPSAYIKQLSHNTDLQSPLHTCSQEDC
ncbi:MAG: AraC family transcriptional regulator, partial [Pedobacter sp.]